LPKFVDDNSLLIATSYSGNTEETLSVVNEALTLEKSPKIVVICSGGELENIARQHNLPLVKLPVGYQPRMTFGYQLRALVEILEQFGLVKNQINNLEVAADKLNVILESFAETVPEANNLAKQLALEAMGKSIVMYASSLFSALAYKWKISFNENAKTIAWTNQFPEFNHNEFLGWTSHPVDKPYSVFELRSSFDNPRITKRFEITEQLLSGKKPAAEVINLVGDNLLDQLLYGIALGDFTSIYLAILNNVDPTPVDIIETFKAKMKG
jgi:glucose/mannose-6-phosphate isomerase